MAYYCFYHAWSRKIEGLVPARVLVMLTLEIFILTLKAENIVQSVQS